MARRVTASPAPGGKALLLEAGAVGGGEQLERVVAPFGGQGGPGQRDDGHPLVGAQPLGSGDQAVQPAGGGLQVGHQGYGDLGRVAKPVGEVLLRVDPAAPPRPPRVGGRRLAEEAGQLPVAVADLAERLDPGGEQPTPQRQPPGRVVPRPAVLVVRRRWGDRKRSQCPCMARHRRRSGGVARIAGVRSRPPRSGWSSTFRRALATTFLSWAASPASSAASRSAAASRARRSSRWLSLASQSRPTR
jgi:hypothetical protein